MLVLPGEWNAIFHHLETWIYGMSNVFDDVSNCWVKYGILFIKVHYHHSKNNTISYPTLTLTMQHGPTLKLAVMLILTFTLTLNRNFNSYPYPDANCEV